MTIRTRFLLSFGAIFLLLILFVVVGQFFLLPRLVASTKHIGQDAKSVVEVLKPIYRLQLLFHQASLERPENTTSTASEQLAALDQIQKQSEAIFQQTLRREATPDPTKRAILAAQAEWEEAITTAEKLLRAASSKDATPAGSKWQAVNRHLEQAFQELEMAQRSTTQRIQAEVTRVTGTYTQLFGLVWSGSASGVIVIIVVATRLARSILVPLDRLTQSIHELSRGNLAHRVPIESKDELADLGMTLNAMAAKIHDRHSTLEEEAIRDGLTGLLNHREFYRILDREIALTLTPSQELALVLIDLDSFKGVNDDYGHRDGDLLLQLIAQLIRQEVRSTDYAARYGGDEFALILPQTPRSGAAAVAERIRYLVAEHSEQGRFTGKHHVTTSIGIALYPTDAATRESLVTTADAALYKAKRQGGNQLSCADVLSE